MIREEEQPKAENLVTKRLADIAEGLVSEFGEERIGNALPVIEKFGQRLYDSTRGFYSNPEADKKAIETVTRLGEVRDSLSKASTNKTDSNVA
jgi:hypothetical protein